MHRPVIAAAFLITAGAVSAQDTGPDDTDPQVAFNNHCRTCHVLEEGDNRLGPNLYEIFGRDAGSVEGFAYSSALESSGITWDEETLDAWIESPDDVVRGHRMKPYSGIDEEEVRAAILQVLQGE